MTINLTNKTKTKKTPVYKMMKMMDIVFFHLERIDGATSISLGHLMAFLDKPFGSLRQCRAQPPHLSQGSEGGITPQVIIQKPQTK